MDKKNIHIILLILWPIFSSIISITFALTYFYSTLLLLLPPSIYLSFLRRELLKPIGTFSLLFSLPLIFPMDYIGEATGAWFVPNSITDPLRFFHFVVLENIVGFFLYVYFALFFYFSIIEDTSKPSISKKKLSYLFSSLLILFFIFLILYFKAPSILMIPYSYVFIGIILLIIPTTIALIKFVKLSKKFLLTIVYFSFFFVCNEFTGLTLGHWSFPETGQFIGMIPFFSFSVPIEELLFFIILTAPAILSFFYFVCEVK